MDTRTDPAPVLDDWAEAVKLAAEMDAAATARATREPDEGGTTPSSPAQP